ncbi:MAG: hypothetical protein IT312_08625 [Anaerolineales bacterium]|nr:hypothetical protein [Anaerolineales bacterium]
MTLDKKMCLVCDGVAVLDVISLQGQIAPLCAKCLADYFEDGGGMVADEVRKYFEDGARRDRPRPISSDEARSALGLKTDETPGEYRTDERGEG